MTAAALGADDAARSNASSPRAARARGRGRPRSRPHGKTAFVEQLLATEVALTICVRGERDPRLRGPLSAARKTDAELRRYRQAGAGEVARYCFPAPDPDAIFSRGVMQDYSEAAVIEGDCPISFVDLAVFVAPPPVMGRSLLRRVTGGRAARHDTPLERFAGALDSPAALLELLGAGLGPEGVAGLRHLRVPRGMRQELAAQLERARRARPPAPAGRWALDDDYAGLERAELVVVNLRPDGDRRAAEALVDDVTRLRTDAAVFRDVLGAAGKRIPITAVVAELANPKDPGLRKALARVKRTIKQARP